MTGDQGKTLEEEFMDRLEKAKGRLQQSFPEIQQLVKTSNAVEVARKIIDPAQSIFRQFADDIQLKDLFAKAKHSSQMPIGLSRRPFRKISLQRKRFGTRRLRTNPQRKQG